jgi:hypothetical protein
MLVVSNVVSKACSFRSTGTAPRAGAAVRQSDTAFSRSPAGAIPPNSRRHKPWEQFPTPSEPWKGDTIVWPARGPGVLSQGQDNPSTRFGAPPGRTPKCSADPRLQPLASARGFRLRLHPGLFSSAAARLQNHSARKIAVPCNKSKLLLIPLTPRLHVGLGSPAAMAAIPDL